MGSPLWIAPEGGAAGTGSYVAYAAASDRRSGISGSGIFGRAAGSTSGVANSVPTSQPVLIHRGADFHYISHPQSRQFLLPATGKRSRYGISWSTWQSILAPVTNCGYSRSTDFQPVLRKLKSTVASIIPVASERSTYLHAFKSQ